MKIDIESLGITKEEFRRQVIYGVVESITADEDLINREMVDTVTVKVRERIDKAISEVAEKYVEPITVDTIEKVVLEETNRWGEVKGKSLTFREYLVDRAEKWMQEDVDRDGKAKGEQQGSFWRKHTNRITYMIDRHLATSIELAMKSAIEKVNDNIKDGLVNAVKSILGSIEVKTQVRSR